MFVSPTMQTLQKCSLYFSKLVTPINLAQELETSGNSSRSLSVLSSWCTVPKESPKPPTGPQVKSCACQWGSWAKGPTAFPRTGLPRTAADRQRGRGGDQSTPAS